ncbi:MAG: tetratricopeptide repeat protein [Sandaracinus sp.]|nr:tetratricopeptide repeat protein [Sandaracinus sp.]MCB9624620.1 tetratricopeptide repeat protein [Sandaracinus sp.]MCB9636200.1 tetratricopeptide repeat protein [Sandaracinus sp.]
MKHLLWGVFSIGVFVGSAHAQSADETQPVAVDVSGDEAEARALFEAGQHAFDQARYEDALERFQSAFRLTGRVVLLYNIGVTADRLRRDDVAIDAFERYLAGTSPGDAQRVHVERRLEILRAAVAEREAVEAAEVAAPTEASETAEVEPLGVVPVEPTEHSNVGPYVLGGAGLALTITGAALLGAAVGASNAVTDPEDGASWSALSDRASRGPKLEGFGYAALGLGVVGLVAAIVWLVTGDDEDDGSRAGVDLETGTLRVRWGTL